MSTNTLCLDLAGVTVAVDVPEPAWYPTLAARYATFATAATTNWRVRLDWDPTLELTDRPAVEHAGDVTHFRVMFFRGWVDLVRRQAVVSTPSAERAPSAIERVLVFILMQMLPRANNGLLLHSVGLAWQGSGHVFFGPSGAGKTTIARMAAGYAEVLCDENVVIRTGRQGPELLSTPFWGQSTPPAMIQRINRQVPLAALYALEHTADFSLAPLSPAQAVVALSLTEKVAAERTSSADAWLRVVDDLVKQVPVYRLGFALRPGLWEFLADAAAGGL